MEKPSYSAISVERAAPYAVGLDHGHAADDLERS
jgi:hypothetical protein